MRCAEPPADPVVCPDPHVPVTFAVTRWFRGGSGDRVTVLMLPPDPATNYSPTYTVGSRLLVSGTDGPHSPHVKVAWPCGFTLWYNRADARAWEQAHGYAPSAATSSS